MPKSGPAETTPPEDGKTRKTRKTIRSLSTYCANRPTGAYQVVKARVIGSGLVSLA